VITTIDKAGRVVIPAALRERLGLEPGTELEITLDDLALRIRRSVPGPTLERRDERLVVRPRVAPDKLPAVDVAALVDDERDRWPV
jgi:AbrB family looped-hinge helix DNA binding protein